MKSSDSLIGLLVRNCVYFEIVLSSMGTVSFISTEWTYQLLTEVSSLKPSTTTTYLCHGDRNQSIDCFLRCHDNLDCKTVFVTQDHCYCSSQLTPDSVNLNVHTRIYVKRPVDVCTKTGYIYYNGICFRRGTEDMTWQYAKRDCESTGGYLIVLDSLTKLTTLSSILKEFYPYTNLLDHYYVGASDIEKEGEWKWIRQPSANFMKFRNGQPNNIDLQYVGQEADCASLRIRYEALVDEYCLQKKPYVCEYDPLCNFNHHN